MKIPSELTREQLEGIVGRIQIILWLDHRTGVLDPDLSWESETLEYVAGAMEDAGLKPEVAIPAAGSGDDLAGPGPGERHDEEAAVRIARLEQEMNDLRAMLERLNAGSYTEVGPTDGTVREAQGHLVRTGDSFNGSTPFVPEDGKISVTFTHVERHGRKTYRAGGLHLSLGGGPGIGHVAMRIDPGGQRWATTDDAAAGWLVAQGLPPDRAARLVADAIHSRDCT
jgi:hypothetical protein